jgi:hypothetical protein
MIQRKLLNAAAAIASVALIACSDTTAPRQFAPGVAESARSGLLHIEKNCMGYGGGAGDSCTITASNVKAIEDSRIIYASAAVGASLNTDVILDPPGPGNNTASGHCVINLAPVPPGTRVGACTLSGGTGKFTHLHASVNVTYIGGPNYAWDGQYSFNPQD